MFKSKVFITILFFLYAVNSFSAENIWFSPNNDNFLSAKKDYKLWGESVKKINVYKFYYQQIIQDTPSILCNKINYLQSEKIKIAVEWPILEYNKNGIGKDVEGFSDSHTTEKLINRFKGCSAKIDYVVMDEPIYWGVVRKGSRYPHFDFSALANNMKKNVSLLKKNFPDVKLGQVEPIQQLGNGYLSIINNWLSEFSRVTGSRISFIHQDVIWGEDYLSSMKKISYYLKHRNIDYGIIFNASSAINDDRLWMSSCRNNVLSISKSNIRFDTAIFQSWNHHPININEESNNDSHISIIKYYTNLERH